MDDENPYGSSSSRSARRRNRSFERNQQMSEEEQRRMAEQQEQMRADMDRMAKEVAKGVGRLMLQGIFMAIASSFRNFVRRILSGISRLFARLRDRV